jgi:hypothetical protein
MDTLGTLETLGTLGFVFATTTAAMLIHEHMTDVLCGPYIERRRRRRDVAAMFDPMRAVIDDAMEHFACKVGDLMDRLAWHMDRLAWHIDDLKQRLAWKVRNVIYLAMMA